MRRVAIGLFPAVMVVACSTFSSSPDEPSTDGGAPVDSAATDAVASDAASEDVTVTDAGVDAATACDLAVPSGVFLRSTFDNGNCDGWQVTGGSATFVTTPTRCGAGSCKVCANVASQMFMTKTLAINATTGGTYQLDFSLRTENMPPSWTAGLEVDDKSMMSVAVGQNGGSMTSTEWRPGQVVSTMSTGEAVSVVARIYANPVVGNECFYIDEIFLSHY